MTGKRFIATLCAGWLMLAASLPSPCRADGTAEQWIAITAPAFQPAVDRLAKQRQANGMHVEVLRTTDILTPDEFHHGGGARLQSRISELCLAFHGKSYVLLFGVVAAEKGRTAVDIEVPTLPGLAGRMKGQPSDNGYGCLGVDFMPTVAVGRLPARTADEAGQMVDKILAYERGGQTESWRRSITLMIGNPGGDTPAQQQLANSYVKNAAQSTGGRINPIWNTRTICHIPGAASCVPDEKLHDQAIENIERGQAFIFYLGHSSAQGFWSNNARFLDRDDWSSIKIHSGSGVFITCGCFACQMDPRGRASGEGFGLAAIRNPQGPVAMIGAQGESYAAMGQLAFDGLLQGFSGEHLPGRLGDSWLDLLQGISTGPIDYLTFTLFDYGDGSQGKSSLELQRLEHLQMWMLLGDPAMRLPEIAPEIALDAEPAVAGETLNVRGALPNELADAKVKVMLQRPRDTQPNNLQAVPDLPLKARNEALMANYEKANQPVLVTQEAQAHGGKFEVTLMVPRDWPSDRAVVRAEAGSDAIGVRLVTIKPAAPVGK